MVGVEYLLTCGIGVEVWDAKLMTLFRRDEVIKSVCSHCILIPQGSTGSITFLVSNESPYFCHYNTKISASNSL